MGWLDDRLRRKRAEPVLGEQAPAMSSAAARGSRLSGADGGADHPGSAAYSKMLTDAQVRAALNMKKLGVLAAKWTIDPADQSAEAELVAEFIRFNFNQMRGSVSSVLWKAMDALATGLSAIELVYEIRDRGPFSGTITLADAKSKDPQIFGFELDEFLNVRSLHLLLHERGEHPLPRDKFVLYTYNGRYESPWGDPDLRAAYQHWFVKSSLLKFWATYLEKYGSPTVMGVYKRGLLPDSQDELLSVLEKVQQQTALIVPEDVQVQLLQATERGQSGYLEAVEYHNREIARAILGQTLTTDEGRHGSRALGAVHMRAMLLQLQSLRRELADVVMTEQIIRPLIALNFDTPLVPQFRFEETPITEFV